MTHEAESPLISVVMPLWNSERFLAEAITSVLAQTFREFELIAVDDGSEDRSREITARFAKSDARVRLIEAAHGGVVAAGNLGWAAARGRYLARMDADDIALPDRLERQFRFLESHPRVALVATAVQIINAAGQRCQLIRRPPSDHAAIREGLLQANCFCHSSIMMRSEVFGQLGGYRSLYPEAEDYDLWTRVAEAHEVAGMPNVLVLYRLHSGQVSLIRLEQQALVALAVRVATEIRWRTGVDPLAGCRAIDRAAVRSLGLSDDEIDATTINAYLGCIGTMPLLGLGPAALEALRDVTSHKMLRQQLDTAVALSGD